MYANDCIEIQQSVKRRGLKLIDKHTDQELNEAIERASRRFGEDFYLMLHGIDAYMERRKRRRERRDRVNKSFEFRHDFDDFEGIWGNN